MRETVQIRCKNNGKILTVPIGSTLEEIYEQFGIEMTYGPVSAKVNNKVEGMHYRVYNRKDVEFLDLTTSSGLRTYTRTLFFVLCKAVSELYPGGHVIIDIPVSNGYFCDLQIGREVSAFDVDSIKKRMKEIIDAKMPVKRKERTTEEAIENAEQRVR